MSTRSEPAAWEEMSWQEIADHQLVLNEVSGTTSLNEWPVDRRPDVAVVCRNFDEWLEAVAANKGLGVVPEFVGRQHFHTFVSFPTIPDAPSVPLNLVHPQHGGHPKPASFVRPAREAVMV